MNELKPCPFCGKNVGISLRHGYSNRNCHGGFRVIQCENCRLDMWSSWFPLDSKSAERAAIKDLVNRWNGKNFPKDRG